MYNFFNGFRRLESLFKDFVDECLLHIHGRRVLDNFVFVGLLLLFALLFLSSSFLAFLFLVSIPLYFFVENEINFYVIVLLEVPRDGDFDDGWVVLKIEEETVKMNID